MTNWLFGSSGLLMTGALSLTGRALRRQDRIADRKKVTLNVGNTGQFSLRSASQRGGTTHLLYAEVENLSREILTGGALSIVNISPANEHADGYCLTRQMTFPTKIPKYVPVATHVEDDNQSKDMLVQYKRNGGFAIPAGYGLLTGRHYFDLVFDCDQKLGARLKCSIFVDEKNIMRIEPC